MAYSKLSLDTYHAEKLRIERLKRFGSTFEFAPGISLKALEDANEEVRIAIEAKNAALELADAKGEACTTASGNYDKLLSSVRTSIGLVKGKESDEWVTAGGTRQSEVQAKQQQTREAAKKAAEDKDKPK